MDGIRTEIIEKLRSYAAWVLREGITLIPSEIITNTGDPSYHRYLCRKGKHVAMRSWIHMALEQQAITQSEQKLVLQGYLNYFLANVKGVARIESEHIIELQAMARYVLQNVK